MSMNQIEPYVMVDRPATIGADNRTRDNIAQRYRGYIPDLIGQLASRLGFAYQLLLVADDKYGHRIKPNTDNYPIGSNSTAEEGGDRWTGMIGQLIRGVS